MYNKVTLIGRLGKDVEIRYTQSQMKIAKFTVATSRYWNDANGNRQEKTEWHNIVAFGKLAELAERMLYKGALVMVEGEIRYNDYTDNSGQKRYFTEISANQFLILSPKRDSSGYQKQNQGYGQSPSSEQQPSQFQDTMKDNFTEDIMPPANDFDDDDVPF
jgi:single-strand DNA-binding protein